MTGNRIRNQMAEQIKKQVWSYAIYRPESALVIAMTIILMGLSSLNLTWVPGNWWLWLLFGLAAEGLIVRSTLNDQKFHQKIADELFHREFELKNLRTPKLRERLVKALEYRQLVIKEIQREVDPVLDDYLLNMARGMEDWIAQLYRLAQGLDVYWRDPVIARDTKTVPDELQQFRQLLAAEKEPQVRAELEKTIAAKEAQWQTLRTLRDTMAQAELQLENTLSAMGTVYTQVRLLGAKDAKSSRAQRLQQDMAEQIHSLEDVRAAMDELYQTGGQR